jgi:hypothetical protein
MLSPLKAKVLTLNMEIKFVEISKLTFSAAAFKAAYQKQTNGQKNE